MTRFGFSGEDLTCRFEEDPREDGTGWDDTKPPEFWQSSSGHPRDTARDEAGPGSVGPWSKDVRIMDLPEGMRPGERSRRAHPGAMTVAEAARAYLKMKGVLDQPAKAQGQADGDAGHVQRDVAPSAEEAAEDDNSSSGR